MKVACLVSLAAVIVMIACGSDSPTPTAPSSQDGLPPGALSGPAAIDPGLPAGVVTVKASAPVPVSPADGTRVGSGTIDLTVTNPTPTYDVQWTFDVRFEVFENANPTVGALLVNVPGIDALSRHTNTEDLLFRIRKNLFETLAFVARKPE